MLKDKDRAVPFACLYSAHKPRSARPYNDDVLFNKTFIVLLHCGFFLMADF
jgi:hypothetical protein